MKNNNAYWIDDNNNQWSKSKYSKTEAEIISTTLTDCRDCRDCSNCRGCSGCSDCYYCSDCRGCSDCSDCYYCRGCSNCSNCRGCSGCSDCYYCRGCSNCSNCRGCSGFTKNPQRYLSMPIGSRRSQLLVYWTNKEDVQIIAGCFIGNLEEFEKAVEKTHGNNKHGNDYKKLIQLIKTIINFDIGE